jgi:hypothetical protein
MCAHAPLSDRGEVEHASPMRRAHAAFRLLNGVDPRFLPVLTRLDHAAYALPVYASQRPLPERHATLGSRCWLGFAGRDSDPQGSSK